MEATIVEPISVASQSYAQSFFRQDPTDSRFINRQFQKFMPSTNIEADTITFTLSRFEAPNVYEIADAVLETRISVTKLDGKLPDTDKVSIKHTNFALQLGSFTHSLIIYLSNNICKVCMYPCLERRCCQ